MLEKVQSALAEICQQYRDPRIHHCHLEAASLRHGRCVLNGSVLDAATLSAVTTELQSHFPAVTMDAGTVEVLRQALPDLATVCTNVTGLYADPSFRAEMVSQVLNGWQVEVLQRQDRWSFVRLEDGYLGWVYQPYTSEAPAPGVTDIICVPATLLHCRPAAKAELLGRVLGGTTVQVTGTEGAWVEIVLAGALAGWMPAIDVRPLGTLPEDEAGRRRQMMQDAHQFTGVPYLWGGGTALGLDCSGFVQLIYRLAGVPIPRDADMQFDARPPVEPPFQPGDLLYFGGNGGHRTISHVGMSLGGWQMIHASRSRNGVYVDDVEQSGWLHDNFQGARTFL